MTEPNPDLHPTLATALACLDVDVDTELARYRRQRQKHEPVPASPPAEVAALTLTAPTSTTGQGQDHDIADYTQAPQRPPDAASSPQDYLASSEKLRQTLDAGEPTPKGKPSGLKWLTPLSGGAIAILGVAIALIVFALREPAPVAEPASSGDDSPAASSAVSSDVGPSGEPLDVTGPDLANDDAADAPTAETPTAEATPSPAGSSPIPGRPSDLTSALLPNPDSPIPSPTATPAEPDPNLDALPNVASPPPDNDPYYYVLVEYGGESSLQQARSVVSDAYLRRFPQGIRVQLGAFDNAADAQRLVNAVQTQGIVAQIYQAQGEE